MRAAVDTRAVPQSGSRARDIVFAFLAGGLMGLMGLIGLPAALVSAAAGRWVMKAYDRAVFGLLHAMTGVRAQ
ncbi:MAG: hypothetical protein AAF899_10810, partial [Pseudomonadota bacterium]